MAVFMVGIMPLLYLLSGSDITAPPAPGLSAGALQVGRKIDIDSRLLMFALEEMDETTAHYEVNWGYVDPATLAPDLEEYPQLYEIQTVTSPTLPGSATPDANVKDIKITVFYDSNNNGVLDANEERFTLITRVTRRF